MTETQKHKKRIGLVLNSVPGYSETFFRNKIKGLLAHGFDVVLFVDYHRLNTFDIPCKVVVALDFSKRHIRFLAVLKALRNVFFVNPRRSFLLYRLDKNDSISFFNRIKQLLRNQYLLSHDLDWLHFGFGTLVRGRENVATAIGANLAVSFRGYDLYLSPLKHAHCFDLLFKKEVKYHVLAEEMKADLIKRGIEPKHIKVITPAIDTTFFTSTLDKKHEGALRLLTIARLHWKKGLEYTLDALAQLKKEGIAFQYTIIGSGEEYERLVFAASQLDILDCVIFTGTIPHDDVKTYLQQTDIYLQYSIQEGFCNAVLEAQAMGLLTIVSNAEGLSENVLDRQSGWVVPKRRPTALKEKIVEVMHLHEEEKRRITQFAAERIRSEFNLEKQNQAFVDFYTE